MAAAEDGDDGFAERGGDVHRAGVLAEVAFGVGSEADEHVQSVRIGGHVERFTGELAHLGADGGGGLMFGRGADEDELEAVIPDHGGADFGPFFERPVLEPGIGGAFTGADDPELALIEPFLAEAAGGGGEEALIRSQPGRGQGDGGAEDGAGEDLVFAGLEPVAADLYLHGEVDGGNVGDVPRFVVLKQFAAEADGFGAREALG